MNDRIRVLIVDDHVMVAQGLSEVLGAEADMEVVGQARTMHEAELCAGRFEPDVVVMDYRLPDGDGAEATVRIRARQPEIAIVMVTASDHDTVLAAAIEAGCTGYVTKDRAAQEVVSAVRAASRGEMTVPPAMLAKLLPRMRSQRRPVGALSPRELEVLQLLAEGLSNQDIADRLVLSISTVRNHVQNVITKLGVHSKLEAVTTAMRQGIIDAPG
ncbi:MAG: response regulator transcription factor [Actinobacteria bacterium]|nr:response regulator transcription factor [Actinomycetota bacterium]